jgi:hypothetical protein
MTKNYYKECINNALEMACYGIADGAHHKQWVIDQMVRLLTGCKPVYNENGNWGIQGSDGETADYLNWREQLRDEEDGEEWDNWDIGIAP